MPQTPDGLYARAQALRQTAMHTADPATRQTYEQHADQMERQLPPNFVSEKRRQQAASDNAGIYGWLKGLMGGGK